MFGTGFSGSFDLPGYLATNDLSLPTTAAVIACDIPSGILADTGQIPGAALAADLTVTFAAPKVGLLAEAGSQHSGMIRVVDIGINDHLTAIEHPWWIAEIPDVAQSYGTPAWDVHKYSRGVLGVVAGSAEYPGAAVLVVNAAAATGSGTLAWLLNRHVAKRLQIKLSAPTRRLLLQTTLRIKRPALWLGLGLGKPDEPKATGAALQAALRLQIPVLVDASALDVLQAEVFERGFAALVLTPHVGEMRRLTQRLARILLSIRLSTRQQNSRDALEHGSC